MIARTWTGAVRKKDGAGYAASLCETGSAWSFRYEDNEQHAEAEENADKQEVLSEQLKKGPP